MNTKLIKRISALSLALLMALPLLASCAPTGDIIPSDTTTGSGTSGDNTTAIPSGDETTGAPSTDTTASGDTTTEGTNGEVTEAPVVNTYASKTYKLSDSADLIKITGRNAATADGISVCWSASGIEFNADCKGDIRMKISSTGSSARYAVYVDGELHKTLTSVTSGTYTIASKLDQGVHNIRLVKCSDCESVNTFTSITVKGLITERPADKDLYIEFIGDSITCGYGLDPSSTDSNPVYNATGSWAYLLAQKIDCDYSIVGVGGIGVAISGDRHIIEAATDTTPATYWTMSDLYKNTFYKNKTVTYTSDRKPDLVMIGLNTNDGSKPTETAYKEKARELINLVREIHGEDVKIVWVFGMMWETQCDNWAKDILNEFGGTAAGYYTKTVSPNTSGFSHHPSPTGQVNAATSVYNFLKMRKIIDIK